MRKAKCQIPDQPPYPGNRTPNPAAPALCRHSTASAPTGEQSDTQGLGKPKHWFHTNIPAQHTRKEKSRKSLTHRGSCLKTRRLQCKPPSMGRGELSLHSPSQDPQQDHSISNIIGEPALHGTAMSMGTAGEVRMGHNH